MDDVADGQSMTALEPRRQAGWDALRAGRLDEADRLCAELGAAYPQDVETLHLIFKWHRARDRQAEAEAVAIKCLALDPNDIWAVNELALLLLGRGRLAEAELQARTAIRIAPRSPQSHALMGMVLTEAQRPAAGEYHYRRVLALSPARDPVVLANLAWNLKSQGRMAESRSVYEECTRAAPRIFQTWLGWARMEEADRQFEAANALLRRAEALQPNHLGVLRARATLLWRTGDMQAALYRLEVLGQHSRDALLEKGRLLDRMGRYGEAWAAWTEAKALTRRDTGEAYNEAGAQSLVERLKRFFVRSRLELLPRAAARPNTAAPIFVLGFPRSGTTLLEQILSSHSAVSAGDELQLIAQLTGMMQRMFDSPLVYPEALTELWMGDKRAGLDYLRDYYLQNVVDMGIVQGGEMLFTDKMPLNETHLGLIALLFPQAPLLHMRRHPLDVLVSVFSNHMTHGFFCAYDLTSAARHYALIDGLVQHYRHEMALNYLEIRYEDLVLGQEEMVRRALGMADLAFEPACLNFHENRRYARTASYAQVSEALYNRSIGRYRNYLPFMEEILPLLEPVLTRHNYAV